MSLQGYQNVGEQEFLSALEKRPDTLQQSHLKEHKNRRLFCRFPHLPEASESSVWSGSYHDQSLPRPAAARL